ncbi:MAG: D-sedoheptulose 7-phosphate isomerase [Gammaproteobacteria bacterium]|nr:D-sedoheptulose 7-phosphate isomerase [Gammaproteobacteria bacterium]MDH5801758.1 D-sedoheptulose 7-phosphate isomerase [Gammaproteobacteria bacterium]
MLEQIKSQLKDSIQTKQQLLNDTQMLETIQKVAQVCIEAYRSGHKLMLAGNGGSAADAQHIAAELVGRFEKDRAGIAAMALTTNSSTMTAVANDYGYNAVFHRQIEAFGQKGDVFIGYSTSGGSANVVAAIQACKQAGIITVGMTGASGGDMLELCDYCVRVPSTNTARIQESHIAIGHVICSLIEEALF